MLASYGFQDILNQLSSMGFFAYILPFLLIFAFSFAVLRSLKLFEKNLGAALIISIAIGLLALQFDYVSIFFANIFPKFGIGVAVLLVALILAGVFIQDLTGDNKAGNIFKWIFFGVGAIIFLIILFTSFSEWQFSGSWWWTQYGFTSVVILLVITAIIIIAVLNNKEGKEKSS